MSEQDREPVEQTPDTPDNVQKPPTTEEQRERGEAQQREQNLEEHGTEEVPYQPGEEAPTNVVENPPQPPPAESDDDNEEADED